MEPYTTQYTEPYVHRTYIARDERCVPLWRSCAALTIALKCAAQGVARIGTPANSAMLFSRLSSWPRSFCSMHAGAPTAAPSAAAPSSAGRGGRRRAAQRTKMKTKWGVLWAAKKSKAWRA